MVASLENSLVDSLAFYLVGWLATKKADYVVVRRVIERVD